MAEEKTAHDYARYFNEWHERDLNDFICVTVIILLSLCGVSVMKSSNNGVMPKRIR